MIRKTILFTALTLVFGGTASAQNWIDGDVFPDSSAFWRGAHGVAVDAEGKVWLAQHYPTFGGSLAFPTVINGDTLTLQTSSLHVYNADGTKAMEPMHAFTFNGVTDTLAFRNRGHANNPSLDAKNIRGVKADHNGDIIVVVGGESSLMFRINHKTGEVMNRVDFGAERFGSPASPGIDAAGNIYVAPVSAEQPISIYGPDFQWIGNVSLNSPGIGRAVEVSADGNSVYWSAYTKRGTYKYHRANEFSRYDSLGLIHDGLIAQGSARHPTTGYIWLGHGGAADVSLDSEGMFGPESELTLYAIDPEAEDKIVDRLDFDSPYTYCGAGSNRNVRGIGFSPDGIYAYVGIFDALQGENADGECKWFFDSSHKQKFVFKKFMRGMVTSIDRDPIEIPDGFTLSQNYPNPFNPQTNIEFEMKDAGLATLKVYDVLGREVATLIDEHLVAGKYTATFNATDLTSGTYVYQLNVAGYRLSGKMTLVK